LAKRGGSKLERKHVEAIAHKLGAVREEKPGKHIFYAVFADDGTLVTSLGVRHGKKSKHGHVPKQLFVNEHYAYELAICTKSKDEYFEKLEKNGKLQPSSVN
jgi:hypothetical protein